MNETNSERADDGKTIVKKTISLPSSTFEKGTKAADKAHRNFSNYIATLIEGDSAGVPSEAVPAAAAN